MEDLYRKLEETVTMTSKQFNDVTDLIDEFVNKTFGWKYPTRNQLPNDNDLCLVASGMKVIRLCWFECGYFEEYNEDK